MGYKVVLTNRAKKQLRALDQKTLLLVAAFIDKLDGCQNPAAFPNAKKLQGVEGGWRWRVGQYRILGTVDAGQITIEIFRIGPRQGVYKNLQPPK